MKFDPREHKAMIAWMKAEKLTTGGVAVKMGVTHASVLCWCQGGGIRPPQRARLQPLIHPYLTLDTKPEEEIASIRGKLQKYEALHPDLVRIHLAFLDQLEDFLARNPQP